MTTSAPHECRYWLPPAAALEQGYRDGQLARAAFTAAVQRVLALRAGLHR